jgi:HEPN domain-containing protein
MAINQKTLGIHIHKLAAEADAAWERGDKERALFLSQQAHTYAISGLFMYAKSIGENAEGHAADVALQLRGARGRDD